MSQDDVTCAICDKECGYDDDKGVWFGDDRSGDIHSAICGRCKSNLSSKFQAFFGTDGVSYDHTGIIIEWDEINDILNKIQYDPKYCARYITTDKEYYEREIIVKTPITE